MQFHAKLKFIETALYEKNAVQKGATGLYQCQ